MVSGKTIEAIQVPVWYGGLPRATMSLRDCGASFRPLDDGYYEFDDHSFGAGSGAVSRWRHLHLAVSGIVLMLVICL